VEGATIAALFEAYYVERILAPSLEGGEVVVTDNLTAHKGERVKDLIEENDCELLYLRCTPAGQLRYIPLWNCISNVMFLLCLTCLLLSSR